MNGGRTMAERGVAHNGPVKRVRIDLGLELLRARSKAGEVFSRDEIALWCGCSRQAICLIEQRALRKLRWRLREARAEG